jgi:phosphoglycerate dehydrogenase-like enzyme
VVSFDAIDAAIPEADAIVLSTPLTEQTRGLMDARRLDSMKRSAVIVNVARGALVDESALIERLHSGRIRGAALDVFLEEPLAAESPLWQLRSMLLTPHVSGVSPGRFWIRELDLFLDNWRRFVNGEPLRNLVDKHSGY